MRDQLAKRGMNVLQMLESLSKMEKENNMSEESRQFFAAFRAVSIVYVVWDVLFSFYCLCRVGCPLLVSRQFFAAFRAVFPTS